MLERQNEEMLLDGFREYLANKGLKEKSIHDDISRINMMKKRNIAYSKGDDYARKSLSESGLSDSSSVSCLRVCRYYKKYLDQRND